jgi:hypothetical protein
VSGGPTYPLATVKRLAARAGAREITETARATAWAELEMAPMDVFAAVTKLKATDFYKTMPSETDPGTMQDVYRPTVRCPAFPKGVPVYCKVQLRHDHTLLVVISFKER